MLAGEKGGVADQQGSLVRGQHREWIGGEGMEIRPIAVETLQQRTNVRDRGARGGVDGEAA